MIKIGDRIPDVSLQYFQDGRVEKISTVDIFNGKRVIMFAVPGAFTPTCSEQHLPGFVSRSLDFKRKGIDEIICISVNDAFVMAAWRRENNIKNEITLIADGNGEFTKSIGMELDASKFGLGTRSIRYAMLINDGRVEKMWVEKGGALSVSKAENVIAELDKS